MNEGKRIVINGTDYTDYFTRTGYIVQYESVQGNNTGMMLDGSVQEDEIKIRTVIELSCMPLNQTQLGNILREIYSSSYHVVEYYDPMTNGYKTDRMRREVSKQVYRGLGADGVEYWTGTAIKLMTR